MITHKDASEAIVPRTGAGLDGTAEQLRLDAAAARERAEQARTEAQSRVGAAQAEAQAIVAAATARAREFTAAATAGDRQASQLDERARFIEAAVTEQERGGEAVQRAAALEAERVQLLAVIEDLDGKLAARGAERQRAGTELAEAETAADIARTEKAGSTVAAADRVLASLARQRQAAAERLREVGDGSGETGEHGAACSAAARHYAKARHLLNLAWPTRPEAVMDAAVERLQGALTGNLDRIAEETPATHQPRQIVHL